MMNIFWGIWELTVTLFECGISMRFVCEFLGTDIHTKHGCQLWIGLALTYAAAVLILNQIMSYEGLLVIIYIILIFIYALAFLPGTKFQKGFISSFSICCVILDSALGANLVSQITGTDLDVLYAVSGLSRFMVMLLVQLMNLVMFQSLTRIFGKGAVKLNKTEWALLIGVFSLSILAIISMQLGVLHSESSLSNRLFFIGSDMAIIFMDFITIRLIVNLNRHHQTILENEQYWMQIQYQSQYAETVQQQEESVRKLRHDFKATIAVLHDFVLDNNTHDMEEYLNAYTTALSETASIVKTNQPFLNAILNTKLTYAKEQGIQCSCHSPEILPDISGTDYCSLFGNLLDNAIETELSSEISEPELHVNLDIIENRLSIYVRNRIIESVVKDNPKLLTTKEQSQNHGYGVATIRKIA